MPIWTNEAPPETGDHGVRLLRTPAAKPIQGVVSSPDMLGCPTHFVNHRTVPCEGCNVCKFCQEGHTWRWHGYLGTMMTATLEHFIFEFTAAASDSFQIYQKHHGNMRGCGFQAARVGKRTNGKVIVHCKPADLTKLALPKPLDLRRILCHIWNIQDTTTEEAPGRDRPGRALKVHPGNGDGRY